jgi:16S rRNA (guanine527-N7)-methyltransferase
MMHHEATHEPPHEASGPPVEDRGPTFDPAAPAVPPPTEFIDALAGLGIELEPREVERMGRYLGFLVDANSRFNLTAVTDPAAMWIRHVLDSLTLLPVLHSADRSENGGAICVLDVGSGGGLPGIPLAIAMPDANVTLLEATGKKARFLAEVTRALGLGNVRIVHARAEDAGQNIAEHRERYDVVTSRAVGPLPTLLELTVPFARLGGIVAAIKGERAAEELRAAKVALHALHVVPLEPLGTPTGTIVLVRKDRATPKKYPRRPGEPKRAPL